METISPEKFPRTVATNNARYDGKIKFVTERILQIQLAEADMTVTGTRNQEINPFERGYIAFRTDDIEEFKTHLVKEKYPIF